MTASPPKEQKTETVSQASSQQTASAPKYVRLKYEMCKNFKEKGECKYGDRCLFAHGDHELIKRGQIPTSDSNKSEEEEKKETHEQKDEVKSDQVQMELSPD